MMRFVGAAQGDPYDPHTASGTAAHLFDAIGRRYEMAGRVDAGLRPWQRYAIALATYHPSWPRWKERFWKNRLGFRVQSLNCRAGLAGMRDPYDVVVQIFGLFRVTGAPYIMYLDNTHRQTLAGWPRWNPLTGRALERWLTEERAIYRRAEHLFTMGEPVAASLRDDYGVPPERVTNVGSGANFAALPPVPSARDEPTIIFVGRDWLRKGGDCLVEAFRLVRAQLPEARLQIIGTTEAPREPGIEVLGKVGDRRQLADLYARARAFCLPSYFDPFPLVLLEAMACGLPCISTAVCGIPEIVADGQTGLLVPPGDVASLAAALLRVLRDPAYAAALGAAGRARVERQFNWDAVVARMAPALERLDLVSSRCLAAPGTGVPVMARDSGM